MNLHNYINGQEGLPSVRSNYRGDLSVVGFSQTLKRRIAASATRFVAGEPLHSLVALTAGVADVNTYVLAAADTPVIGTHAFGGVALVDAEPRPSGTVIAHDTIAACPIPWLGKIRGRAETTANADTRTELTGLLLDSVLIDYNATGAVDSGELYTIKDAASANTSGLQIVDGNTSTGTLDVIIDGRAYRTQVA